MISSPCDDCGVETNHNLTDNAEWYMVKDIIWVKTGNARYLCIGCLEKRLGRRLVYSDFKSVLVNLLPERFCQSERLRDRLRGLEEKWDTAWA